MRGTHPLAPLGDSNRRWLAARQSVESALNADSLPVQRNQVERARTDRRYLARDVTRLMLGGYRTRRLVTRLVALTRPRSPAAPGSPGFSCV